MSELQPARPAAAPAAAPFLKWAGGKAALLAQYKCHFPARSEYQRYVEPFVGGGAVFFHLASDLARLADVNPHLMATYQVVRDDVESLIAALGAHTPDRDHFDAVRELDPADLDPVAQAARFIYLNRTCYNGLYRVNRSGRFNVPYGRYANPTICDAAGLRAASARLQGVELLVADFEDATADCGEGDFVYFDPPYVPTSATANFTEYADQKFGEAQQRRLATVFCELDRRGCHLLLSNSDTPLVHQIYKVELREHYFPIRTITARRSIGCDATKRGLVQEVLISNRPLRSTGGR